MSLFDLLAAMIALAAAAGGWRMGFISRAASWAGMLIGFVAGLVLLPLLVDLVEGLDERWLFLLVLGVLATAVTAGHLAGVAVGRRLRTVLNTSRRDVADQLLGAVAGFVGVVAVVWLLAPAFLAVSGWPRRHVLDSSAVRGLNAVLGEPPDVFDALIDAVDVGGLSTVFGDGSPEIEVGPIPSSVELDDGVEERVRLATARVESVACSQRQDGTGFFIGAGLIMTNAHVVAGAEHVGVTPFGGATLEAHVVLYDPGRDLAVLAIPEVGPAVLELADGVEHDDVAVFGHPLGGELRMTPATLAERVRATGRDLYDEMDISRQVYFLAAALERGDSGAPVVDRHGKVVALVFAIAPDDEGTAFALTAQEVRDGLAAGELDGAVSTRGCLS